MGQRIKGPGVCRWCRCDHFHPCPEGCGWAAEQLCTECVDIERAWQALRLSRKPNMHRAFFRGFTAGANDERAIDVGRGKRAASNPYGGATRRYWQAGFEAGAATTGVIADLSRGTSQTSGRSQT